ncbi:aspartate aminotransferase family protein [Fischerella sp. JS2]|uniref:aspartate aminotransferase family protein n=1 Tax=Fischerella sp. JS2 TaxID=2597771 RepID=UPI0028F0AAC1|nr:aspartate aminotransferase family protein [Fischerella sp. JS2]
MFNSVLEKHLENFIARYTKRTKTSKLLRQNYRSVLADTQSAGKFEKFYLPLKEIYYPIVGKHSLGSKLWDIDNNEYIDVRMGLGINLFGHNPPFIKEALTKQIERGIQLGLQSELAGEVAELICELTGMERVTFINTGTEAVMTAIRLARTVTGREKIVIFSSSYHGHFDGVLVKAQMIDGNLSVVPTAPGIPQSIMKDVLVLDYGNPQSLEVIKAHKQELAAVLVVPVHAARFGLQLKTFLQKLRLLTKESGIPLIFDEMTTGFRIHPGGAQAYFDVEADIATYGKIIGGGMPIGVIAGKACCMDAVDGGMWNYGDDSYPSAKTTFVAGTFCKHPLAMAAARAVLKHLKTQGSTLQAHLNQRTSQFVQALNSYLEKNEVPIRLDSFGSAFFVYYLNNITSTVDVTANMSMELFRYHLIHRGIHIVGSSSYLSTAHTEEDINYIIQAVKDSVTELRQEGLLIPVSYSEIALI